MRSTGGLLPRILTWENFVAAAHRAACGKRDKAATIAFFSQFEKNLAALLLDVVTGHLRLGEYTRFVIHDPKKREICAPGFRERVLHHALMNYCEPVFERAAIYDSYACRKGKGQQAAVTRATNFAKEFGFFLKLDIRRFFDSIDHAVLLCQLARLFREGTLLDIFGRIVDSYSTAPGKGLPIGALTSQHFANSYLSPLDRHLKEVVRVRGYVRYMDDFVIWASSSKELIEVLDGIERFLAATLLLQLKPQPFINRTRQGMDFLGYRVYPGWIQLSRGSKHRFAKKLRFLARLHRDGQIQQRELQQRLQALVAFTRFARTWHFRRGVLNRLAEAV